MSAIGIELRFSVTDRDESGMIEEVSITQNLDLSRRGHRWLAVESESESGAVGVGQSFLLALLDYLRSRALSE